MSGFRTLHREQIDESAIWSVQTTPLLSTARSTSHERADTWRIWTAHSDGTVRTSVVTERALDAEASTLDASALSLQWTHVLVGGATRESGTAPREMLGCTQLATVRNYVGEDDAVGDLVVIALGLSGLCRIWVFTDDWDDKQTASATSVTPKRVPCKCEFILSNATGTSLSARIVPTWKKLVVAVGCLDGTISIVDTGIATPSAKETGSAESTAGTILDTLGTLGSAIPLTMAWHATRSDTLVVGRQDGVVDMVTLRLSESKRQSHRLLRLVPSQTRAVAFTPDGNLLVAGNDDGMLCVWDVGNKSSSPALVHFVQRAHASWILNVHWLMDSRRFVTVGAEQTIHVWSVGQLTTPLHTFHDAAAWSVAIHSTQQSSRMVTGSDTGWLQVFSLAT